MPNPLDISYYFPDAPKPPTREDGSLDTSQAGEYIGQVEEFQRGYVPDYWEDPQRVARYHELIESSPPGAQLPDWLDQDGIRTAYDYFKFRNNDNPWWTWTPLDVSDPGRELLLSIPRPPVEALWPGEERFAPQTGTEQVQQQAEPAEQPGFETYGMSPEQWDSLSAFQKWSMRIFSTGRSAGAVTGAVASSFEAGLGGALAGSKGGIPGAVVGGLAGATAGAAFGGALGAGLGGLSENAPQLAQWLQKLDYPAEWIERAIGTIALIGLGGISGFEEHAFGGSGMNLRSAQDVIRNLDAAWQAAHLTYDVAPIGGQQAWTLGEPDQRTLSKDEMGYAALAEVYRLIRDGQRTPEQAYQEVQAKLGFQAELRDMAGHMLADPLNFAGLALARGLGYGGKLLGMSDDVSKVLKASTGLTEAAQGLGAVFRGKPQAELSQLGSVSRWFLGVTETGELKALSGLPGIAETHPKLNKLGGAAMLGGPAALIGFGIGGPVGGLAGALGAGFYGGRLGLSYLANLTPAAQATEIVNNAGLNLALVIERSANDPDTMVRYVKSVGNTPHDLAAELSMRSLDSPHAAAIPMALKDFGPIADNLLVGWHSSEWSRNLLDNIASILGKDQAEVLAELSKTADADVLLRRYVEAARQSTDSAARAIVDAFNAGDLTAQALQGMVKHFVDDGLAFDTGQFKGQLYSAMIEHMDKWAAEWFKVKPDTGFIRLGQTIKSAQSLVLLGINPGYFVNNVLNNIVTMAADGVLGLRSEKEIAAIWKRAGVIPPRLAEGLGPAGDVAAAGIGVGTQAIRQATIQPGPLENIRRAFNKATDKLGIFSKLSAKAESLSSTQAYTSGFLQSWSRLWKPGVGFERMPAALERALGADASDLVYQAIRGGMNQGEIESALWSGFGRRTIDGVLPDAAAALGKSESEVAEALRMAGVYDYLREKLQGEVTDQDVHRAFDELRQKVRDQLDEMHRQELINEAEKATARVQGEGMQAAVDIVDAVSLDESEQALRGVDGIDEAVQNVSQAADAGKKATELYTQLEMDEAYRWLEGYANWEEVFAKQDVVDAGVFNALVQRQIRIEKQEWSRTHTNTKANYLGIMNALGVENETSRQALEIVVGLHDNWDKFYEAKWKKWDEFGKTIFTTRERRLAVLREIRNEIDLLYSEHAKIEQGLQGQLDELFINLYGKQYGPLGGEVAKGWRKGLQDMRDHMVTDMRAFRDSIGDLPVDEKRLRWQEFLSQNYRPQIIDQLSGKIEGAWDLYEHGKRMQGGGTVEPTPPGGPQTPPSTSPAPPAAPPPAPITELPITEQAGIPASNPAQAWEQNKWTEQAAREASGEQPIVDANAYAQINEARQIASEYGLHSINEDGSIVTGADRHILNILNKYAGTEYKELSEADPTIIRQAFDRRQQMKEAVQAAEDTAALERQSFRPEDQTILEQGLRFRQQALSLDGPDLPGWLATAMAEEAQNLLGELGSSAYQKKRYSRTAGGIVSAETNVDWYSRLYEEGYRSKKTLANALERIVKGPDPANQASLKYVGRARDLILERLLGDEPGPQPPNPGALLASGRGAEALEAFDQWFNSSWAATANDAEWGIRTGGPEGFDELITAWGNREAARGVGGEIEAEDLALRRLAEETPPAEVQRATGEAMQREHLQEQADQWQKKLEIESNEEQRLAAAGADQEQIRTQAQELWGKEPGEAGFTATVRGRIRDEILEAFPELTRAQIDDTMQILDARARSWAKANGKDLDEWYATRVAEVVRGGEGELAQAAKGATQFLEDGRAVVNALKSPDISTLVHEIGHIFRRDLEAEDLTTAAQWAGAKLEESGEYTWSVKAEEKFAKGFEEYLREGKAPKNAPTGLVQVFERFKGWLAEIYSRLKGEPLARLNPEMRKLYEGLLSENDLIHVDRQGRVYQGDVKLGLMSMENLFERREEALTGLRTQINEQGTRIAQLETENQALKTNKKSNLPLFDAYQAEVEAAPIKVYFDVQGLGWVNKQFTHAGGDKFLATIGATLDESGAAIYHKGGDEFVAVFDTTEAAQAWIEQAGQAIREMPVLFESGERGVWSGFEAYFGMGKTVDEADAAMGMQKKAFLAEHPEYAQQKNPQPPSVAPIKGEAKPKGPLYQTWFETDGGPARLLGQGEDGTWLYQVGDEIKNLNQGEEPAAAGLPLGSVESGGGMPLHRIQADGFREEIEPMLAEIEGRITGAGSVLPSGLKQGELDPTSMRELQAYLEKIYGQQSDTKLASIRWGEARRDAALLPYYRRYGVDNVIQSVLPYSFFYTRYGLNWALRSLDRPAWLANYARVRGMQSKHGRPGDGYPTRLVGKMQVPAPFLPKWAGGNLYLDPLHQVFPFEMLAQPIQKLADQRSQEERRAEYILEQMVADETITAAQASQALQSKSGDIWQKALTQAGMEVEGEIQNPFDFITAISGPSLPVSIAYNLARGKPEKIGLTPATRFLQSVTAWAKPGGVTGPEGWLRQALGQPERGFIWDFYVDRELANMAAEDPATIEDVLLAMTERQGPLYEQAMNRVGKQQAVKNFSSFLWVDFFPEGEQIQRELQQEFSKAIDNGTVGEFFEAHPDYRARLELKNWEDPEARLRNFLQSEIWTAWREAPALEQRGIQNQLGDLFQQAFLNKETRSYDSITTETLAAWAGLLGGTLPEGAPKGPQMGRLEAPSPAAAEAYQAYLDQRKQIFPDLGRLQDIYYNLPKEMQDQYLQQNPQLAQYWDWRDQFIAQNPDLIPYMISEDSQLAGAPETVQYAVYQYRGMKAELFPGIGLTEDQYYDLSGAAKKAFLQDHPELRQYWDWKEEMQKQTPEIIPFVRSARSIAKGLFGNEYQAPYEVDPSKFSPPVVRQLLGATYAGQELSAGIMDELQDIWIGEGKPLTTFEAWLAYVQQSMRAGYSAGANY